jgi:hypothetical protein
MQCPRCQGLMVPDHFSDLLYDGGYLSFDGWRCLCCGNVLDPVILGNRQAVVGELAPVLSSGGKRRWRWGHWTSCPSQGRGNTIVFTE